MSQNRHVWLRAGALAALLALLLGAFAPGPALAEKGDRPQAKPSGDSSESGNPFGGLFGGDDEDEEMVKVLDTYEPSGHDYSAIAVDRPRALGIFRSWAYGLVSDAALDAYVNKVLRRIMAVAPEKPIPAKAYVLSDDTFGAYAAPDGGIFITLGMLRDLENEDELAFVLGHELSHIIYRHHDKDWYLKTERRALTAAGLTHETLATAEGLTGTEIGATKDFKTGVLVGALMLEAHTVVIDPAFTREQEDEADLLGLDLMIAAGYNMAATITLLEKLDIWEKQQEAKKPKRTAGEREADMEEAATEGGLGGLFGQAFEDLTSVIEEEKAELSKEHVPAAERNAVLQNYMLGPYMMEVPPPITPLAWHDATPEGAAILQLIEKYNAARSAFMALGGGDLQKAESLARKAIEDATKHDAYPRMAFYSVRKAQGKGKLAKKNLELAMAGKEPSFAIYARAIEDAKAAEDWQLAVAHIEEARKRLADTPTLLPLRIEVYPKVGRKSEVAELLIECKADYPSLADRCAIAAGQEPAKAPEVEALEEGASSLTN
ncbi:MAG: M48 family metalloprotease [Pseudomonadota bacterium]